MPPTECPKCHADLAYLAPEESIPDPLGFAVDPDDHTVYSRVIGIYDRDKDRTTHWRCPDCNHEWRRE